MNCNCNKNIEGLHQVVCSLKKRFDTEVAPNEVIMTGSELASYMADANNRKFLYGILNCGVGTTIDLKLLGGCDFQIVENTQIIVLIDEIENISAPQNAFFRGYELSLVTS
ncbi:hypothetical protein [Flagellimonas onchidii]|uniref:hypothetical protein n=1 Tax=Flagellimonas onchidii TaxID=2562684 RepID=UPI0010A64D18|nr:hypothetical protein [Allomuricauda onchidii]